MGNQNQTRINNERPPLKEQKQIENKNKECSEIYKKQFSELREIILEKRYPFRKNEPGKSTINNF